MATQESRKLRPIAILCALALIVWGAFAVAALVADVQQFSRAGWPHDFDLWPTWAAWLAFASYVVGVFVLVCGLLGLRWRPPLHLGVLAMVVSVAFFIASLVVINRHAESWSRIWRSIWNGITWKHLAIPGVHRWWYFVQDILLPLAVVVLILWIVVLATGAGKRRTHGMGDAFVGGYATGGWPPPVQQGEAPTTASYDAPPAPVSYDAPPVSAPVAGGSDRPVAPGTEVPHEEAVRVSAVRPEEAAEPVEPVEPVEPGERTVRRPEPAVTPPPVDSDTAPADEDARVWFVNIRGADHGPYSKAQLREYLAEGRLHEGTLTHLRDGAHRALSDVLG